MWKVEKIASVSTDALYHVSILQILGVVMAKKLSDTHILHHKSHLVHHLQHLK